MDNIGESTAVAGRGEDGEVAGARAAEGGGVGVRETLDNMKPAFPGVWMVSSYGPLAWRDDLEDALLLLH